VDLASAGLTSREACGDTVRNVMGCHLAGACPFEVLDISPWAEATFRHFLRNPIAQRLPRKFKINFSGCVTDCGQAMFNDVGVVAVSRPRPDGTVEPGFRVFIAGGLGPTPTPPRRSRSSPPARTSWRRSSRSCGSRTTTATATTSCVPA
jgi:sulfite reductase beta subunit-like hemoprotein